jgi:hypothetical protein
VVAVPPDLTLAKVAVEKEDQRKPKQGKRQPLQVQPVALKGAALYFSHRDGKGQHVAHHKKQHSPFVLARYALQNLVTAGERRARRRRGKEKDVV